MKFDSIRKDVVNKVVTNVFDNIEAVEKNAQAAQNDAQVAFDDMEKEMFDNEDPIMTTYDPFNDIPVEIEDAEVETTLQRIALQGMEYTRTVYEEPWKPNRKLAYRLYPISHNANRCNMTDNLITARNNNEDIKYVYYSGNDILYKETISHTTPTTKTIPNDHKYDKIMVRFPNNPEKDYVTWTSEYFVEHLQIDDKHNYESFGNELPLIREIDYFQTKILICCKLNMDNNAVVSDVDEITPYGI